MVLCFEINKKKTLEQMIEFTREQVLFVKEKTPQNAEKFM